MDRALVEEIAFIGRMVLRAKPRIQAGELALEIVRRLQPCCLDAGLVRLEGVFMCPAEQDFVEVDDSVLFDLVRRWEDLPAEVRRG